LRTLSFSCAKSLMANTLKTLKKNKEFSFVYHRGNSYATKLIVLVYFYSKYGGIRSGFSVSKKIGGAVVRNKVRRRLKAALSSFLPKTKGHASIIFVARKGIELASYQEIEKQMKYLLKKAKLLQE
jgi:ribonuclease P protein component